MTAANPLRQDKLSSPRNPKEESATNSFLNLPAIQKTKNTGMEDKIKIINVKSNIKTLTTIRDYIIS